MATTIEAIYEHGVFRPTEPVGIADGVRVQIVVVSSEDPGEVSSPASILAEIAALPLESQDDETTARDHDRFLYGSRQP
jgi:predicted DNA-binding antitoxin AbrB/MazE fold protein